MKSYTSGSTFTICNHKLSSKGYFLVRVNYKQSISSHSLLLSANYIREGKENILLELNFTWGRLSILMDVGETTIILDLPCLASQNHKENLLERKMKLMKKTFFGFYPKPHHSRSLLLTVTSYVQPLRFVPSQKFHRREGGESGAGLFRRASSEKKRGRES